MIHVFSESLSITFAGFSSCKSSIHYLICSVDLCLLHITDLKPLERQDIFILINSKGNYIITQVTINQDYKSFFYKKTLQECKTGQR